MYYLLNTSECCGVCYSSTSGNQCFLFFFQGAKGAPGGSIRIDQGGTPAGLLGPRGFPGFVGYPGDAGPPGTPGRKGKNV